MGKYLFDGLFLLGHGVFAVVAAVLADDLGPFGGGGVFGVEGVDEAKGRTCVVIWLFELVEEFDAGGVGQVAEVEGGRVEERREGACTGGKTDLVLTFVLLSTHLIIIRKTNN